MTVGYNSSLLATNNTEVGVCLGVHHLRQLFAANNNNKVMLFVSFLSAVKH